MIEPERDVLWFCRQGRWSSDPAPWERFGYNSGGPVNALVDLPVGMDWPHCSPANLDARAHPSTANGGLERIGL